jgi:hypothetical protein
MGGPVRLCLPDARPAGLSGLPGGCSAQQGPWGDHSIVSPPSCDRMPNSGSAWRDPHALIWPTWLLLMGPPRPASRGGACLPPRPRIPGGGNQPDMGDTHAKTQKCGVPRPVVECTPPHHSTNRPTGHQTNRSKGEWTNRPLLTAEASENHRDLQPPGPELLTSSPRTPRR